MSDPLTDLVGNLPMNDATRMVAMTALNNKAACLGLAVPGAVVCDDKQCTVSPAISVLSKAVASLIDLNVMTFVRQQQSANTDDSMTIATPWGPWITKGAAVAPLVKTLYHVVLVVSVLWLLMSRNLACAPAMKAAISSWRACTKSILSLARSSAPIRPLMPSPG